MGCREVEVLIGGRGRLDAQADAARQVAAVGVVADLPAVAEEMQRISALEHPLIYYGWKQIRSLPTEGEVPVRTS